jgi:hypothetical protein
VVGEISISRMRRTHWLFSMVLILSIRFPCGDRFHQRLRWDDVLDAVEVVLADTIPAGISVTAMSLIVNGDTLEVTSVQQ